MKERIQKILAAAGVDSRRNIEEMVRQGRISVNGKTLIELPILVDPEHDRIEIDDQPVRLRSQKSEKRYYILMNKPKGVYCTNVAQGEQRLAIDLLPPDFRTRVYPVGRLDAESKGLLLLTNDGELTNQLTHPKYGVSKTYRAFVDGFVKPESLQSLSKGVWLSDQRSGQGFKTARSQIRLIKRSRDKSLLEITLREGRNRQVRRMLARLGHKVRELTRIRFGPLTLDGLNPGQSRLLLPRELSALRRAAHPPKPEEDR